MEDGQPLDAEGSAADQEGQEGRVFERQTGGDTVPQGVYWSRRSAEFVIVASESGQLAGGPEDRYFRTPLLVVLVAGPLMGLAFAMFLPVSGLLVLGQLLLGRVRGLLLPRMLVPALAGGPAESPDLIPPGRAALPTSPRRASRPAELGEGPGNQVVAQATDVAAHRWQEHEDQGRASH